jgi:hypothetical protein
MRQLLRRSLADLSRTDRQAIQLATRQFDSRQAVIPLDPACEEAAVWLLTAMHWCGYRHPGELDRAPSHPPTGLVRWLASFRCLQQEYRPQGIVALLPLDMRRMEYRSRVLVTSMVARRGTVALLQDVRLHFASDGGCATRARRVLSQRVDATLLEPMTPQRHLTSIQRNLDGDVLVLPALGCQQDHTRSLLKPGLDTPLLGQASQLALGRAIKFDRLGNSHRFSLLGRWSMPNQLSSITSGALH